MKLPVNNHQSWHDAGKSPLIWHGVIDFSDKQRGPGRPRKRQHNSGSSPDNAKSVLTFIIHPNPFILM